MSKLCQRDPSILKDNVFIKEWYQDNKIKFLIFGTMTVPATLSWIIGY